MKTKILMSLLLPCLLLACKSKTYENKSRYEIAVGETVDIYYFTNSCCEYFVENHSDLQHLTLINNKIVDPGPKDCAGCDFTGAFTLSATSIGTDSVLLNFSTVSEGRRSERKPHVFLVEVK